MFNYFATYLSFCVQILSVFILGPIVEQNFTSDITVKFFLLFNIISMFGFMNLGLPQALQRLLVNYSGTDDYRNGAKTFYVIFLGIVGLAIVLLNTTLLTIYYTMTDIMISELLLIFFMFLSYLTFDFVSQFDIATGKIWLPRLLRALQYIVLTIAIYINVQYYTTFTQILLTVCLASYLPSIFLIIKHFKTLLDIFYRGIANFHKYIKSVFEGLWYFLGGIVWITINNLDGLLVYIFFDSGYAIMYLSMFRILDAGRGLVLQASAVIFPKVTMVGRDQGEDDLLSLLIKMRKAFFFLSIFGFGFILLFGYDLYTVWMPNAEYHDLSIFVSISIFHLMCIFESPFGTFAGALGIHKRIVLMAILQLIFKATLLLFAAWLQNLFLFSISGAIALLLTNFWFNPYFVTQTLKKKTK